MANRMLPRCAGLGLMEVLTASGLLATGIACLLQMQLMARQIDISSRHRLEASLLGMELSERLEVMRQAGLAHGVLRAAVAQIGMYQMGEAAMEQVVASCVPEQLCPVRDYVQSEIAGWLQQANTQLPALELHSELIVLPTGLQSLSLSLSWAGGELSQSFVL